MYLIKVTTHIVFGNHVLYLFEVLLFNVSKGTLIFLLKIISYLFHHCVHIPKHYSMESITDDTSVNKLNTNVCVISSPL